MENHDDLEFVNDHRENWVIVVVVCGAMFGYGAMMFALGGLVTQWVLQ